MSICPHAMSYARPSRDVALVRPVIACFVAVYGAECGRGTRAESEPLLMIRPPRGDWAFISRNACLRAEEGTGEVRLDDCVPLLEREILERHSGRAHTGVVEQHVESSEPRVDLGEERRHRRRITDVAGQGDSAGACLAGRRLERLETPAGEDDGVARACQRDRGGTADAAAGARDQRDPGHRATAGIRPPSSSSTWTRMISSKSASAWNPSAWARRVSKLPGQPETIRMTVSSGSWRIRRTASSPATRPNAAICSAMVTDTPGMFRQRSFPSAPASIAAAWTRKPTAERGEACQCRTSSDTGNTASCPFNGSRMMLEKKPEAARFGLPGRTQMRRQADTDAVEKAATRVVGQQQLGHRLLRPVAGQGCQALVVADHLGKWRAEDGNRRGEHHAGTVTLTERADGVEQGPRSVEVDAVALLEIGLRFARDDGGEVEDDVGTGRHELTRHTMSRQIGDDRVCGERSADGPVRLDDVGERQVRDRLPPSTPSRTSRAASLRPSMPAPPTIRMRTARTVEAAQSGRTWNGTTTGSIRSG